MAAYVVHGDLIEELNVTNEDLTEVHIGDVIERNISRVMTFQVDGDELEAVLWGLANYKK